MSIATGVVQQPEKHGSSLDRAGREELILAHVASVKYHADRLIAQLPPSIDVGDLMNAGVLGLMEAVERFDPSRGVKFRTFVDMRIRGAMLDSLRTWGGGPKALRRKAKQLEAVTRKLQQEQASEVDDDAICRELGVELHELHELNERIHSMNVGSSSSTKDGQDLLEYHPGSITNEPHYQFERQELRAVLAEALDRLGPKERLVISLYYFEELTMKEIGAALRVNESRVSQLHSKATMELRSYLKSYSSHLMGVRQ